MVLFIKQELRIAGMSLKCTLEVFVLNEPIVALFATKEKIAEECKDFGLEMIGPTTTHLGQYRKYKFVSCGHTIDTAPEAIRDNRFECKPCIEAEFLSLIEPQGLKVLPKKSSNGYRWFSLPCGCEKIRMEHARNGNWICGNCDDSYYTKDSNLYLVQYELDGFSWLKFGFAET